MNVTETECPICCFSFQKKLRKPVTCFNCQKTTCSSCIQHFILESATDAKCLHCNIGWDRRFMNQHLSKQFCNVDYRHHKRNMLYERQKSHLPLFSTIQESQENKKELEQELIALRQQKEKIEMEYRQKLIDFNSKISHCGKEITTQTRNINNMLSDFIMFRNTNSKNITKEGDNVRNRPCISENCLGFLNGSGFCPVCKKTTCLSCNVYKKDNDEKHECKKEDKQHWEHLKKSTKPCPSCRVRIFKISGCDQMWCTNCNTPFSWKHEKIERGPIHNPHYYDWVFNGQNNPRGHQQHVQQNQLCAEDELPFIANVVRVLQRKKTGTKFEENVLKIKNMHQKLQHLKMVEIPILLQNQSREHWNIEYNIEQAYRKNSIPYLFDLLNNKKEAKKRLEQFDNRYTIKIEASHILNTYFREQVQIFHLLYNNSEYDIPTFIRDFENNKTFFEEALINFGKEYNTTTTNRMQTYL